MIPSVSISVITATLNPGLQILRLIDSLKNQSDQIFEWVVADGGSTDGTQDLLTSLDCDFPIRVDSAEDCGIYDALNRAIAMSSGTHYLVVGADDTLSEDAIANFKRVAVQTDADLVSARIRAEGQMVRRRRQWEWLYGQFAHIDAHAVGLLVRKALHDQLGLYSLRYQIAADQDFVIKAVRSGAVVERADFVAGEFGTGGTSSARVSEALTEGFRVQVANGHKVTSQALILGARLIRHRKRISPER